MTEKKYKEIKPIVIREFVTFLRLNNSLRKFKCNCFKYKRNNYSRIINYIQPLIIFNKLGTVNYQHYYQNFIMRAFTWTLTKEGYDFWYKLNLKWMAKLNNIKFQYDDEEKELPF